MTKTVGVGQLFETEKRTGTSKKCEGGLLDRRSCKPERKLRFENTVISWCRFCRHDIVVYGSVLYVLIQLTSSEVSFNS